MEQEKLSEILELHRLWLKGDKRGIQANFLCKNLKGIHLQGADLREANLIGACLSDTDLQGADLSSTDLGGIDCRKVEGIED